MADHEKDSPPDERLYDALLDALGYDETDAQTALDVAMPFLAQAWHEGLVFGQQHWATNYAGVYQNGSPLRAAPNPYQVSSPADPKEASDG